MPAGPSRPEYDRRMRLYDSLTRDLVELPPPPGPIGIYVCGSTVYQRIHVGNSRPFVLGIWLRNWLRHTGYEVTFVHNITDVDDKVYAEAVTQGVPSRELSERATAWFFEDTDALGLGRPDLEPRATETIPEIVEFIQELVGEGEGVRGERRRVLQRRRLPGLRSTLGRAARGHGHAGDERAEARSARLRALEVSEAARGRSLGLALGAGTPWLAHRVLCHGREVPRLRVRDPRWRERSSLPAPRERARAVPEPGPRVRQDLDAQRHARARRRRRCPSRSATS